MRQGNEEKILNLQVWYNDTHRKNIQLTLLTQLLKHILMRQLDNNGLGRKRPLLVLLC